LGLVGVDATPQQAVERLIALGPLEKLAEGSLT
jgi:hypothetical protein